MRALLAALLVLATPPSPPSVPTLHYLIRISPSEPSSISVELQIRHPPNIIRLAMASHPEYDDRYWRYVTDMTAAADGRPSTVVREDSALWRVAATGSDVVVRYSIRLPPSEPGQRAAWRPFLAPSGALVGGPHTLMYLLGEPSATATVTLDLPAGWAIATGLEPAAAAGTFAAPSQEVLLDSPMLVGRLRQWQFDVGGVHHRVVYWAGPNAAPFDTTALVGAIARIARQSVALFGSAPYRDYVFLLQDDAYGALEHRNSVTLGAPSSSLAEDQRDAVEDIAHEYFHAWNLMRIRPVEIRGLDYHPQVPINGLWWSEGLTMFYADLLLRRAALPDGAPTRIGHLEHLITRYLNTPGNRHFSAERLGQAEYAPANGGLGDYASSVHLQGELIGVLLDLAIRDATDGRRSMDDVMRLVYRRFGRGRGFDGRGIQRAVTDICRCDVSDLFDGSVRGAAPLPFDRHLRRIGLRTHISRAAERDRMGRPAPDLRVFAQVPDRGVRLALVVMDPESVWSRAGLHTGDELVAVNGAAMTTWREFRSVLSAARIGDTLRVDAVRRSGALRVDVVMEGYEQAEAHIEELPAGTPRMQALRGQWAAGR